MRTLVIRVAVSFIFGTALAVSGAVIESTFNDNADGWTQTNLGGDYRYLDDIVFDGDCLLHVADGVLTGCDPDAGTWMFEAPAKFLGDQSANLDGYFEYAIRWQGAGEADPANPVPNLILVSSNVGIAMVLGDPPANQWTTNRIRLDEQAGWLWMDDETGMENLPRASRAQIEQVLRSVTALRITGEFINGSDTAFLDNVVLSGSELNRPRLNIRLASAGHVELSWPATATQYVLESTGVLPSGQWLPVHSSGNTTLTLPVSTNATFFRLRQP